MLIEYKFKFEKNGLTIVQQVGSGASDSHAILGHIVEQNSLSASYQESLAENAAGPKAGGGNGRTPGGGGGNGRIPGGGGGLPASGIAPVTFIGPFIMCCPHDDAKKEDKE